MHLTHWLPEVFAENSFFDIFEIFRLDVGHISSNLPKKAFVTWQCAFLSTSGMFYDFFVQACAEIKILAVHGRAFQLGKAVFTDYLGWRTNSSPSLELDIHTIYCFTENRGRILYCMTEASGNSTLYILQNAIPKIKLVTAQISGLICF